MDEVLNTALTLVAAGFSVVPIKADGSKSPDGEWKPLQTRIASPEEIRRMFEPHHGLAIVNGAVSGNKETIDVDDPSLVAAFESAMISILPGMLERLVIVASPRNNHGGRHYHYRCDEPVISGNQKLAQSELQPSFKDDGTPDIDQRTGQQRQKPLTLIETRGQGGIIVVPPTPGHCHATGLPYEYASVPELVDCPTITADERSILLAIARSFNQLPVEDPPPPPSNITSVPAGTNPGEVFNEQGNWEDILAPLNWVPAFVTQGITHWRRPGKQGKGTSATTGVKSQSGNSLFCVFSSNAHPFEGGTGNRICTSYTKFGAYTVGHCGGDYNKSAAKILFEKGLGIPKKAEFNKSLITRKPDPDVNLDGILNPKSPEPALPFPADCLTVPGLINDIVEYNLRTAMYPQPEMALAAAIALMATITGRKIRDTRGTRTNAYILALAPSGSGKEHARKINKTILLHSGAEKMVGPERVASSAGLVSFVADQPSILFQLDEIGRLITTMQNPAKAPHLYNIATVLMQLYSSSDSLWVSDAYADAKKTKRINQPHACIYGTSVPGGFWESLSSENIADGLLGRLMVFEARTAYVAMQEPKPEPVPETILASVRQWVDLKTHSGNLDSSNPSPLIAAYTEDAQSRMADHFAGIHQRRLTENETTAAVWSRAGEKTSKLALIFACSRMATIPLTVDILDVERAIKISNWLTRRMLQKADAHISENETEGRLKRVLRILEQPLTMSELTRKTQWLRSKERQEIIQTLVSANLAVIEEQATATKPMTRIRRL